MVKTKNFNPVVDLKLLCTCGHQDCDKRSVDQSTLNRLQKVRDNVGRPMVVTSGGRCPNHPDEVHRAVPADHQKCKGIDIMIHGCMERGEIVTAALLAGFNAIGIATNFIHLGYRSELRDGEHCMWNY